MDGTRIKIANCPRCKSFVHLSDVDGCRTAADMVPLDRAGVIQALVDGRGIYRVHSVAGRADHLSRVTSKVLDAEGELVGDHGCGASPISASAFVPIDGGPPKAPVTAQNGASRGLNPPPGSLEPSGPFSSPQTGVQSFGAATDVTPRRSDGTGNALTRTYTCEGCGQPVPRDDLIAVEHAGAVLYAHHATPCTPCQVKPEGVDS